MAARKLPRDGEPNPISIRLPSEILDGLDAWLADLNNNRPSNLVRTDLIRGVLAWAIKNRPEWEESRFRVELWKDGRLIASQGVLHPPGGMATFYFDGGGPVVGHLKETMFEDERLVLVYDTTPPEVTPAIRVTRPADQPLPGRGSPLTARVRTESEKKGIVPPLAGDEGRKNEIPDPLLMSQRRRMFERDKLAPTWRASSHHAPKEASRAVK